MNFIDLISDLHNEHWDKSIPYKPWDEKDTTIHAPFKLNVINAEILVVAGDITDNIDDSIIYLNTLSKHYKYVLFVDGNHEHYNYYPKLYSDDDINSKFKANDNKKLIFLTKNPFIYKNNVFIGCNGWWDYNNSEFFMKKDMKNKMNWYDLSEKDSTSLVKQTYKKSKEQVSNMEKYIKKYSKDTKIKNIHIVTHTVPIKKYCSYNYPKETNTNYDRLYKYKKIKHWFYGHSHSIIHDFDYSDVDNVTFVCNPRGRPSWANRVHYNPLTITL